MRYFFIILFAFLSYSLQAQSKFDLSGTKLFANYNQIFGGAKMKVSDSNNYYIAGTFIQQIQFDGVILNSSISSTAPYARAIYLAKFDSSFNIIWVKKIVRSDTLSTFDFVLDSKENIIFCCDFVGHIHIDSDSIVSKGSSDILLLKLNSAGNIIFTKQIGGTNGEGIGYNPLCMDQNDNFFIGGIFNGTWTNIFPNYNLVIGSDSVTSNNQDIFIAKFDSIGNSKWAKSYGGAGTEQPSCIYFADNRLYLLAGVQSQNNQIGGLSVNYPEIDFLHKCFVAQLDTNGVGLWAKRFGSENTTIAGIGVGGLAVSKNRICFSGGSYSNTLNKYIFDGAPTLNAGIQSDFFIASYDTLGNFKWHTASHGFNDENLLQQKMDSKANLYSVGHFNGNLVVNNDTLFSNGGRDVMLVSFDSVGSVNWKTNGGGAGNDLATDLVVDNHGKIYIVGGTTSSNGCYMGNDTLYPPSGQSTLFFASMDSIPILEPVGIKNILSHQNSFQVFPNPANTQINIRVVTAIPNSFISMSNLLGQEVITQELKYQNTELDISNIPNGVYFITLKTSQGSGTQKIIIQH